MLTFSPATTPEEFAVARELFLEYQDFLPIDLCFQGFAEELANLPTIYGPPRGSLLLGRDSEGAIEGCGALRDLGGAVAEIKRMFLREAARGHGLGRVLLQRLLDSAKQIGYREVKLDTLARLTNAVRLYRSFGFEEIRPYNENPEEDVLYFSKKLDSAD